MKEDQRWKFVSIDRAEESTLEHAGMRASLYSNAPDRLIPLLARPMPRKRKATTLKRTADHFDDDEDEENVRICKRLKRDVFRQAPPFDPIPYRRSSSDPSADSDQPWTFTTLPLDIHHLIFENAPIETAVCLAMTNNYFWSIGVPHIRKKFRASMGSWAGTRIIHPGEFLEGSDEPQNVFSKEELDSWPLEDEVKAEAENGSSEPRKRMNLYSSAMGHKYKQPAMKDLWWDFIPGIFKSKDFKSLHFWERAIIRGTLRFEIDEYWPPDEIWILRNLTLRQYVRADAIALKPEMIRGPAITAPGFGTLLMFKTSWSSNPSTCVLGSDLTRGEWAGHRFDIVAMSMHKRETRMNKSAEQWTDVSETVAEEMAGIYERNSRFWKRVLLAGARDRKKYRPDADRTYFKE